MHFGKENNVDELTYTAEQIDLFRSKGYNWMVFWDVSGNKEFYTDPYEAKRAADETCESYTIYVAKDGVSVDAVYATPFLLTWLTRG